MQSKRAWLVYVLVRLLAFAIPFAVIMLALRGWPYDWVAAGAAGALISLLVSYIFLRQHRNRMGADLRALRNRHDPRGELELEEDAELKERTDRKEAAEHERHAGPGETESDGTDDERSTARARTTGSGRANENHAESKRGTEPGENAEDEDADGNGAGRERGPARA